MLKNQSVVALAIDFNKKNGSIASLYRHVAQPGSAPSWGVGGRRFKSSHADQHLLRKPISYDWFFCA